MFKSHCLLKLTTAPLLLFSCASADFTALEENWHFDELRFYSYYACLASWQSKQQNTQPAWVYQHTAQKYLKESSHSSRVFYHLQKQAQKRGGTMVNGQQGCKQWVFDNQFRQLVFQLVNHKKPQLNQG